jgi:hypothetical protein
MTIAATLPPGVLPSTDAELLDWMEARLRPRSPGDGQVALNYNMASQYYPGTHRHLNTHAHASGDGSSLLGIPLTC